MANNVGSSADLAKPVSVLFICLGNICRSTMAEGVFRYLAMDHPLISRIDSCGTGAYHTGDQPDPRTIAVLEKHEIVGFQHKARKIRIPADLEEFDYLLCMDEDNLDDVRNMIKRVKKKGSGGEESWGKVMLYGEFGGKGKDEEVADPYYGGGKGFDIAFEQLERFGKNLLKHIEEESKK